jgi:hypothetical protein
MMANYYHWSLAAERDGAWTLFEVGQDDEQSDGPDLLGVFHLDRSAGVADCCCPLR